MTEYNSQRQGPKWQRAETEIKVAVPNEFGVGTDEKGLTYLLAFGDLERHMAEHQGLDKDRVMRLVAWLFAVGRIRPEMVRTWDHRLYVNVYGCHRAPNGNGQARMAYAAKLSARMNEGRGWTQDEVVALGVHLLAACRGRPEEFRRVAVDLLIVGWTARAPDRALEAAQENLERMQRAARR